MKTKKQLIEQATKGTTKDAIVQLIEATMDVRNIMIACFLDSTSGDFADISDMRQEMEKIHREETNNG